MAFYPAFPQLPRRFRLVQSSFMGSDGLAFADALPEDRIQQVFDEEGANFGQDEDAIYTPAVTLWASLTQTLFQGAQRSYGAAVARVCVLLVTLGKEPPSGDTGAYCRARAKLPERGLRRLSCELADNCEQAAPRGWFWRNRHVKLVDGFTASMPDSEANRAVYPKQTGQKEGLGFPIARMVVLLSLCTGMLCGMAIGRCEGKETGEPALLRQLLGCLKRGDIVLSDRFYCSYFMVCLLLELGVDFVVRLHQRRKADFTRGKRLGEGGHIVTWKRPERPEWMDEETYQRMTGLIRSEHLSMKDSSTVRIIRERCGAAKLGWRGARSSCALTMPSMRASCRKPVRLRCADPTPSGPPCPRSPVAVTPVISTDSAIRIALR